MPQTFAIPTAPRASGAGKPATPMLLSPIRLGGVTLRNRLCLTGHGTGMPVDGTPNEQMIRYYEARAQGEVGLIMLGSQQVHPSSPGITGLLCNYDDSIIPGLARLARRVQAHGTRIFGYLSHMGFATSARPGALWSASPGYEEKFGETAHEMTEAEIAQIVEAHAAAAARCIEAGLDGIEIHCGHGLLVQQFLSPLSNARKDGYGGSADNRLRFAREILAKVRDRIGPDVPLGIRCSGDELIPGGLTGNDMALIVPELVRAGRLDFVDVSAGSDGNLVSNMLHEPPMGLPLGPFRSLSRQIKDAIDVPVIHGTRIPTAKCAEDLLVSGDADMAGMARGLIADPALAQKAREGRIDEIVPCIACEQACFGRLFRGQHISCVGNPATGREGDLKDAPNPCHVLVIGGGPAGMESARIAAMRRHKVTLMEGADRLGGRLQLAAVPPGRSEWSRLIVHKIAELKRLGVNVLLGQKASVQDIVAFGADKVILATGARNRTFKVHSDGSVPVRSLDAAVRDLARGKGPTGRILVVDHLHRAPAIAAAIGFAQSGGRVTLCSSAPHVGQHLEIQNLTHFYREALRAGIELAPMSKVQSIQGGKVAMENTFTRGVTRTAPFDVVIAALPGLPDTDLASKLLTRGIVAEVIGDAYAPRDAEAAILDGYITGAAA